MKNPFTSNDNIFDKFARKQPSKREPVVTRTGSTRERTPTHLDRLQRTGSNPAERGAPLNDNAMTVGQQPYGYGQSIADAGLTEYASSPARRQQQDRFALPAYNTHEDTQQPFKKQERKPFTAATRLASTAEPIARIIEYSAGTDGQVSRQKTNFGTGIVGKSTKQSNEPLKLRTDVSEVQSDPTLYEGPPQLSKPNPFLKPHLFEGGKPQDRNARKSAQAPLSPGLNREKSLTVPRKADNYQAPPDQQPYQQISYQPISKQTVYAEKHDKPAQLNLELPAFNRNIQSPNNLGSGRTATSQDTLQKLNDLFNCPDSHMPTYHNTEISSPKGERVNTPLMNLDLSPLHAPQEQKLDPSLFENYIKLCLMNEKGREQLRNLVGIDIPQPPQADRTPIALGLRNIQPMATRHDNYQVPSSEHQYVTVPTFAKIEVNQQQPVQAKLTVQTQFQQQPAGPQQHEASSLLIRDSSPSYHSFVREGDQNRSSFIELDDSVPTIKPYEPAVLTEKSNLKMASSSLSEVALSQLKPFTNKTASVPEQQARFNINCNLNKRVQQKLRRHYEGSSTRVFLSFGEKLTMRHYPLQE